MEFVARAIDLDVDANVARNGAGLLHIDDCLRDQFTDVNLHLDASVFRTNAPLNKEGYGFVGRYYLLSGSRFQIRSEDVDRVDIDRPAHAPDGRQRRDLCYEAIDHAV